MEMDSRITAMRAVSTRIGLRHNASHVKGGKGETAGPALKLEYPTPPQLVDTAGVFPILTQACFETFADEHPALCFPHAGAASMQMTNMTVHSMNFGRMFCMHSYLVPAATFSPSGNAVTLTGAANPQASWILVV